MYFLPCLGSLEQMFSPLPFTQYRELLPTHHNNMMIFGRKIGLFLGNGTRKKDICVRSMGPRGLGSVVGSHGRMDMLQSRYQTHTGVMTFTLSDFIDNYHRRLHQSPAICARIRERGLFPATSHPRSSCFN